MLHITIPATELWDEANEEFKTTKEITLQLEHSLVSLSKWESKWCKPFLSDDPKSDEEILDYIKCMTITQNVDSDVYNYLSPRNKKEIDDYIKAPMTATWFRKDNSKGPNREVITSEVIYYYMFAFGIPIECQKWHLNRLMTLIRVCDAKNKPPEKMSRNELLSRNAALNAARRKKLNSKG